MKMMNVKDLIFRYRHPRREPETEGRSEERAVLDQVSLQVEKGDFVGILGHNGSGKSTLAKLLAALLHPSGGVIYVKGMDTADPDKTLDIRKTAGIVFQNPDNQIIGSTVEEDVAFGMENLGLPREVMTDRITTVLEMLDLSDCRLTAPGALSGGQRQKVAISGILAMEPECIVFDEPTAMLDPSGRREVMKAVRFLNREKGITVIYITHHPEEVMDADKLYIMRKGKVALFGAPGELWGSVEKTKEVLLLGVDVPFFSVVMMRLAEAGICLPVPVRTEDELVEALADLILSGESELERIREVLFAGKCSDDNEPIAFGGLSLENVSYSYGDPKKGRDPADMAIRHISLSIKKGESIAIAGRTGSGKSTLLKHLNGLLLPTAGVCRFDGKDITDKDFSLKTLRQKAAYCFQYPEYQLFEETVIEDIAFGPSNMGLDRASSLEKARRAMELTGVPSELAESSPFTLSGGQKRRVALAGILAMEPEYLILDEPAAGLDREGKERLFSLLKELKEKKGITLIMVSHAMNDAARLAGRIVVMKGGEILADGPSDRIFSDRELLFSAGLEQPDPLRIWDKLEGCLKSHAQAKF